MYLRHCDNTIALKGRVAGLKFQLMQKYGDKGRNIANLCTANYLEDWLIPAYGELSETLNNDDLTKKNLAKYIIILLMSFLLLYSYAVQ